MKNKWIKLIVISMLTLPTLSFAQTAEYKPYDGDFALDQLPKGTIIQFNEEIKIDKIKTSTPGGVLSSESYIDGSVGVAVDSRTSCKFSVYTAKQDYFGLLVASQGFTIPKDTWASVIMSKQTSENDASVFFLFNKPIKTTHAEIGFATLDCHLGTGAWWANSDEKIHVKNARSNLGNRITILKNYIQPEMTKEQQLAAYMNRLKYLLSLLNGGSQSVANSYVGVGYGVGGAGGFQSGIGASSGGGSIGGSQNGGQSALEAEIADLIQKINKLLQDPEIMGLAREGTDLHDQLINLYVLTKKSNTTQKNLEIPSSGIKNNTHPPEVFFFKELEGKIFSVGDIFIDANENIYFCFGGLSDSLAVSKDGGLTFKAIGRCTYSTKVDNKGTIYSGTTDGLMISKNGGKSFTKGLEDHYVFSHDIDSHGAIYAGTDDGLMISKDAGKSYTKVTEFGDQIIFSVAISFDGAIYVASEDGVYVSKDQGVSFDYFDHRGNYLATDAKGFVYVATNEQLNVFKGKRYFEGIEIDDLQVTKKLPQILSLKVDKKGTLYVGTIDGLMISIDKGNSFTHVLKGERIRSIGVDAKGIIYIGIDNAIKISKDGGETFK